MRALVYFRTQFTRSQFHRRPTQPRNYPANGRPARPCRPLAAKSRAAEVGGKIYVMGGYEKNGNLVEEYDPATDSWRGRAPLPKPLHHIGAAALNGKIYVIGGYISGVGPVDTVYEYDPAKDQWTSEESDADPARGARRRHHLRARSMLSAE